METLLALGDRQHQFLNQDVLALVVGEVQLVEAGVSPGQSLLLELPVDVESLHPIDPSQLFEPLHRYFRTTGHKLQESRPQFHIELFQDLKEPHDDLVMFQIVHQPSVPPQILDIDGWPP